MNKKEKKKSRDAINRVSTFFLFFFIHLFF